MKKLSEQLNVYNQIIKDAQNEIKLKEAALKEINKVEPIAVITPSPSIITKKFNFTLKYETKYLDKYYY